MTELPPADPRRPYRDAAWFYAEYRYHVGLDFCRTLAAHLGLGPADRMLDLGCGPAIVGRRLAPFVGEVVAVDPEPAMLDEGRRRCRAEGISNVTFVEGSSHDLERLGGGQPFRLVTIGMAFHWMAPQDVLLRRLDGVVDGARGAVALVSTLEGPEPLPAWRTELHALLQDYLAGTPDPGHPGMHPDPRPSFVGSPFPELEELRHESTGEEREDVESALGFLYTLSWVLARLGTRRAAFEAEAHRRFDALVGESRRPVPRVETALIARRPAGAARAR